MVVDPQFSKSVDSFAFKDERKLYVQCHLLELFNEFYQSSDIQLSFDSISVNSVLLLVLIYFITWLQYRTRLLSVSRRRYSRLHYHRRWFEIGLDVDKEYGIDELDGTIRRQTFRYEGLTNERKGLYPTIKADEEFRFWDRLVYMNRVVYFLLFLLLQLATAILALFVISTVVSSEIDQRGIRPTTCLLINGIKRMIQREEADYSNPPKNSYCSADQNNFLVAFVENPMQNIRKALDQSSSIEGRSVFARMTSALVGCVFLVVVQQTFRSFISAPVVRRSHSWGLRKICVPEPVKYTLLAGILLALFYPTLSVLGSTIQRMSYSCEPF